MDAKLAEQLAARLLAGEITPRQFAHSVSPTQTVRLEGASLDLDRRRRCGFPEVVFAPGKPLSCLIAVVAELLAREGEAFATRVSREQAAELAKGFPEGRCNELAGTFRVTRRDAPDRKQAAGRVAVVTAGTGDLAVAEEARETLDWMRVETTLVHDVGVAGPQRLLERLEDLRGAAAVVVVAGMEGALPSVVGGHLDCPVIAVPTSIGYGASFGGVAALLGMLNSCAANVAVVNIDGGFKGGYLAGLIAHGGR